MTSTISRAVYTRYGRCPSRYPGTVTLLGKPVRCELVRGHDGQHGHSFAARYWDDPVPGDFWPDWDLIAQTDKRSTAYGMAKRLRDRAGWVYLTGDGWYWVFAQPRGLSWETAGGVDNGR